MNQKFRYPKRRVTSKLGPNGETWLISEPPEMEDHIYIARFTPPPLDDSSSTNAFKSQLKIDQ